MRHIQFLIVFNSYASFEKCLVLFIQLYMDSILQKLKSLYGHKKIYLELRG